MAAEIIKQYPNAKVELVPSSKGRFEVMRDGRPIFEKSKLGRHADPGEVLRMLTKSPQA